MGSMEASLHGGDCSFEKHLICSICLSPFKNPVTTDCGHTFCQNCLYCNFQYNDRMCPLCKQPQRKAANVNIVLKNIIEQISKAAKNAENEYRGEPGEVACDVCTEWKLKAEKSCLVCLASYCSTHIQNHFSTARLRSHKLVPPVKDLDERACLQHGRPLELYSTKDARCICVHCMEEVGGGVVSTENEWNKKKASKSNGNVSLSRGHSEVCTFSVIQSVMLEVGIFLLQAKIEDVKSELEKEVKERKAKVAATSASLKSCLVSCKSQKLQGKYLRLCQHQSQSRDLRAFSLFRPLGNVWFLGIANRLPKNRHHASFDMKDRIDPKSFKSISSVQLVKSTLKECPSASAKQTSVNVVAFLPFLGAD